MKTYPSGVPLGGLGCGKIELCPDGAFRNLTTHNNLDQPFSDVSGSNAYTPSGLRDAFAFVAAGGEGARAMKYAEADFVDVLGEGGITYEGLYPRALLSAEPFPGLAWSMEAFSPLAPDAGDPKNATLPAAVFLMRAESRRDQPVAATLGFSWPNAIGCGGYPHCTISDRRDNRTSYEADGKHHAIRFYHAFPKVDRRLDGEYILLTPKMDGGEASWSVGSWSTDLWHALGTVGRFPNRQGEPGLGEAGAVAPGTTGMLAVQVDLDPGEAVEVPMVLGWSFPDMPANLKPGVTYRNAYARYFDSARAAAVYASKHRERLLEATRSWQHRLLDSSLPEWLSRKLINNLFPMASCSMYLDDGRFSINEAPTDMAGCMGTIDQRAASASAYTMLLPEIARSELKQFADQQIDEHHPKRYGEHWSCADGTYGLPLDRLGAIKHELGWDELEEGKYGGATWCNLHWPDLSAVFVLQAYQQTTWSGDEALLDELYPKIKLALAFHQRLDQDDDGIADLWGPGSSTFDNEQFPYYGASTFVATLYLAALRAAQKLALRQGETEYAASLQAAFEKARATVERDLWDDDLGYYLCWYDRQAANWQGTPRAHEEASRNAMLAQLAGTFFAAMLDLGDILDPERVRRALTSLHRINVHPHPYCPPNEVKPDGTPSISWPYYGESYFAANAIYHGLVAEGTEMVLKFYETVFVKNRSPWDAPLSFEGPDNSVPHWGRWYMTNPSSWTVLAAIHGVRYNALDRTLTLLPNPLLEMDAVSDVPVFFPCWSGRLSLTDGNLFLVVDRLDGVETLDLEQVAASAAFSGPLHLNGRAVEEARIAQEGPLAVHTAPLRLREGDELLLEAAPPRDAR